jgi:mitochondrial fission protein ELM1
MKILWVKDGKLGHEKQVDALLKEISKDTDTTITENITKSFILEVIEFLSFGFIQTDKENLKEQDFDLIIGAGNKSFIRMANLAIICRNAKIVSILCPNYLLRSRFDHICIPIHDNHKKIDSNKKITFEGSLSSVFDIDTNPDVSMIAIGGNNKHFNFDIDSLIKQINYIVSLYPSINWHIFNSRRTPEDMNIELSKLTNSYKNIFFIDVDDSNSLDLFKKYTREASMKLVTPDSVNMVYECLSSRGETILLNMPSKKNNKIVLNINALKKDKRVGYISTLNLSEGITTHKLEKQNIYFDVLREVEKLSYSILKSIN